MLSLIAHKFSMAVCNLQATVWSIAYSINITIIVYDNTFHYLTVHTDTLHYMF